MGQGVPAETAAAVADLHAVGFIPEIMQIAVQTGATLKQAAAAYFTVTDTFRIARINDAAGRIRTTDRFEALALARSVDEIAAARRAITTAALSDHLKAKDPVGDWIDAQSARISRARGQISSLTESGDITLAKMAVAAGMMSDLVRVEPA